MSVEAQICYQLLWYFHVLILHSVFNPYFMFHVTFVLKILTFKIYTSVMALFNYS
jgi:hypothetical protein